MYQAMLFQKLAGGQIECRLCAHYCRLKPGQSGPCRIRRNVAGRLLTLSYGRPVAMGIEPIEKKRLFHAFPGRQTLSLGTPGCNMSCQYCINWRVSQGGVNGLEPEVRPAEVVDKALAGPVACIAFTYTEATIFFEYALEIARLARRAGLAVVAKSNGYMSPIALEQLAPWLEAINIDLKAWQKEAHYKITGARLGPVLDNLRLAKKLGLWLEVSTLLVPGLNDNPEALNGMAHFIAAKLGPDTPWHLLRFFPSYLMRHKAATSQASLEQAVARGRRAGLRYVYAKELGTGRMWQTTCPNCQAIVLEREGFDLVNNKLRAGCCAQCGRPIAGVGLNKYKLPIPTPAAPEV